VGPAIRKLENEKYSDQNAEAVRQRLADIKTYGDDYYQDWIRKLEQEMIPKRRLKDKQESTQEAIQAVQTAVQAAMNAYKNNPNQENRVAARKALTEAAAALDAAPYTD
jgi:acetoin utilization deacetylase AcuC-like enzyme